MEAHICPRCGGDQVRWSKRRGAFERVAAMVVGRPMRCRDCRKRFFGWRERRAGQFYQAVADRTIFRHAPWQNLVPRQGRDARPL